MLSKQKRVKSALWGASALTLGLLANPIAMAQSADEIKSELLLGLMQPLPITIVGPLMASNLEVEQAEDMSTVTLERTMLMGAMPLGDVSFDLKSLGDKRYQISNFSLPNEVSLPGDMALKVGSSTLDGVWSFETRSYETMKMTLNDVSLSVGGGAFELGNLENLTFEIDQQGKSNIESSRLSLTANGLTAVIPGQSKWNIGQVGMQVGTKTGEPLDIHALITQGIQAGLMSNDMDRVLGMLDFLRKRQYENLEVQVSGRDVDIDIEDGGSIVKADTALISLTGGSVSEQRIGNLSLLIDGRAIDVKADEDVSFSAKEVNNQFMVEELPLADVLNAVTQVQLALEGATVDAKISDLYDAFLGFNLLSLSARAVDLDTVINDREGTTKFSFDYAAYQTELQGFRDLGGVITNYAKLENFDLTLPEVATARQKWDSDNGEYREVPYTAERMAERLKERELLNRTIRLFAPKALNLDGSITGFGDKLIHKILSSMPVDENLPTNLAAAAAVIPTLELATNSSFSYETEVASIASTSDLTYVPMRIMSFNPYTGMMDISFNNWDAFIEEGLALMDGYGAGRDEKAVATPLIAVLEGYGERMDNSMNWNFMFDGEKDYIMVNEHKVYFGSIMSLMSMGAFAGAMRF